MSMTITEHNPLTRMIQTVLDRDINGEQLGPLYHEARNQVLMAIITGSVIRTPDQVGVWLRRRVQIPVGWLVLSLRRDKNLDLIPTENPDIAFWRANARGLALARREGLIP